MRENLVIEAQNRKRRYPSLNAVISDADLEKHVEKYGLEKDKLLTLGSALLYDRFEGIGSQILRALNANLAHFFPILNDKKIKQISANLLNGRDQFLNTLSELGLARSLSMRGRTITLVESFHNGKKDVDVADNTPGAERLIEVVNLAVKEAQIDGFVTPISDDVGRLAANIKRKYDSKFAEAISAGWDGPMWIALDIIKNDMIALSATLSPLNEPNLMQRMSRNVLSECVGLRGVIYYTHYAYDESAFWVIEFPRHSL